MKWVWKIVYFFSQLFPIYLCFSVTVCSYVQICICVYIYKLTLSFLDETYYVKYLS